MSAYNIEKNKNIVYKEEKHIYRKMWIYSSVLAKKKNKGLPENSVKVIASNEYSSYAIDQENYIYR